MSTATEVERRAPAARRGDVILSALAFVAYSVLSLVSHRNMRSTAMDLSIFEQGVAAYSRLEVPTSTIKGPDVNLLGDHFHPILALLAPFYRIWPHASTLLIAQAVLVALSVYIVSRTAREILGSKYGLWLGVAYALSWGVIRLVAFDFHEVAFALPILALTLRYFVLGRHGAAALTSLLLLLVKEDMGLTVAMLGLALALRGSRRLGLGLFVGGMVATALVTMVIVPSLNSQDTYAYFNIIEGEAPVPEAGARPAVPNVPATESFVERALSFFVTPRKLRTVFLIVLPTLFLALFSPLVLLLLPTLAWRMTSVSPLHWDPNAHYNGTLMVIVFVAAIDVARRQMSGEHRDDRAQRALATLRRNLRLDRIGIARLLGTGSLVVALVLTPFFDLRGFVLPSFWECQRCANAEVALDAIPDEVSVAADNQFGPQLSDRTETWLLAPKFVDSTNRRLSVDYVMLDLESRFFRPNNGPPWAPQLLRTLEANGYDRVVRSGPYVVLKRTGPTDGLERALGEDLRWPGPP